MQNKEHTMIKIENMHARVSMFCSISFTSVLDAFKVRTSIQQRRVKSSSKDYCKPLADKIPPTTATFEHPITNKNWKKDEYSFNTSRYRREAPVAGAKRPQSMILSVYF